MNDEHFKLKKQIFDFFFLSKCVFEKKKKKNHNFLEFLRISFLTLRYNSFTEKETCFEKLILKARVIVIVLVLDPPT